MIYWDLIRSVWNGVLAIVVAVFLGIALIDQLKSGQTTFAIITIIFLAVELLTIYINLPKDRIKQKKLKG